MDSAVGNSFRMYLFRSNALFKGTNAASHPLRNVGDDSSNVFLKRSASHVPLWASMKIPMNFVKMWMLIPMRCFRQGMGRTYHAFLNCNDGEPTRPLWVGVGIPMHFSS